MTISAPVLSIISLLLNLLLGGGAIAFWLKYRVQIRGEDRVDFNTILQEVKDQRDEAWSHIKDQDQRIDLLEAEIQGLRIARDLDPFPNWVVDLQGCFRFANREFEAHFLEPSRKTYRDVIGKTYDEFWPEAFCRTIKSLSAAAHKRPDGTARAVTTLDVPSFGPCEVTVHKFPIRFKGAIVAHAGFITAIEPETQRIGQP